MNKYLFCLLLFCLWTSASPAGPADYVWKSPSKNSSESMPCGGGSIGMNVWVENGDILFYVSRSGAFDELNTLLKQGRFRIRLSPALLDASAEFEQRLNLNDGYIEITDGSRRIRLWADVFKPVIHVTVNGSINTTMTVDYESWRYRNRAIGKSESFQTSYKFGVPKGTVTGKDTIHATSNSILFYHQNSDSTVFDATVAQQQLTKVKHQMYNPLGRLISGGRMRGTNLMLKETKTGIYQNTDYRAWSFSSLEPARRHDFHITLSNLQGTAEEWLAQLNATESCINAKRDAVLSRQWWNRFWQRSFIIGHGDSEEITRNYTLFRYMMGCNAMSEWPVKFNGGLFCFDPIYVKEGFTFTPDYRRWGGGTHTAQNQRLLYWPLLKTGDADLMKQQLDFYLRILANAELRSKVYWNHGGACFTEQIENFGLPEHDEYGKKRPVNFDPGLEYNAWLEYCWDTVLEFCQMALERGDYAGEDVRPYLPLIQSSLDFFEHHYRYIARQLGRRELDDNGHLVLYPGSAGETFKMAYNATSTCLALRMVNASLVKYLKENQADTALVSKYCKMQSLWPDISYREVNGYKVIAPAAVWARVNNVEPMMLYPVFPWRRFGIGRDSLQVALDTWHHDPYVRKFNGIESWEQANIWAACLGLTDDAVKYNKMKLGNGPHRFPAFWGPGHDWTPDHNWGGSGMIGLQEMLLQEVGNDILLFPAWPKEWDIHFKLHAKGQTTVEAILKNGEVTKLLVTPRSRAKDIKINI